MHPEIREIMVEIGNELNKWDPDDECANHLVKLLPQECEFKDDCSRGSP
ncbi:MAG: hypothetical protein ACXADW_24720 [Candidatus Hodarchaeales archaeon]|jgi:hypothetical protein